MNIRIESLQNEKVKNLVKLQKKASERKSQNLFVVEGRREVSLALKNNIAPHSFFVCKSIYAADKHYPIDFEKYTGALMYEVSSEVYRKIAYRGDTQGVIMIGHNPACSLNDAFLSGTKIILVLESIEKPGNLGAVFRTADAAGVNGIIICGNNFDIYNPNVIRSSLGCIFSVKFALSNNEEALKFFKKNNYNIYAAHPENGINYTGIDYSKKCVVVLGTESEGLSDFWKSNASQLISIPMLGQIDSLNISVSAAVIAYEALKSREIISK